MIFLFLAFPGALFMAWTIGADSASPSFGPVVSSGSLGVLKSSLLAGLSAFLGAVLQGGEVTQTLSEGFVKGITFSSQSAATILIVSSTLIAIGIWRHYPMPTAYTLVGAVLGGGLGLGGKLNVNQLTFVLTYWILLPLAAGVIGFLTSKLLRSTVERNEETKRILRPILIFVGLYTAFTAGAASVGQAVGPLLGTTEISILSLLIFGGIGILIGALTGSPKIIHAVARDYADIGPRRSISALVGTSILAQVASILGIPISFNAAILGGVIGSGFASSNRNIGFKRIGKTGLSWVVSFFLAFGIVFLIVRLF
ncbi:MAG: anion permease [Candidatus Bipolaricaulota bacterium]